ncbi:MAG: ATP-dependent DNA helicase [Candidatus Micrarchaeia archaeon]
MELFRFEKQRQYQGQMISDIYAAVSSGRSIIVDAPTGVGKTDAALSAALRAALEKNLNIFFLTPKISQHKIAVEVLLGINEKFGIGIKFSDIVGKRNLCTNPDVNGIESEAFYSQCDRLVKNGRCPFFSAFRNSSGNLPSDVIGAASVGHNQLLNASYDHGLCAYEAATYLAKQSRVIIADYAHILSPSVRSAFLKKTAHRLSDSIVIWDEAHNIIDLASKYTSTSITTSAIDGASRELDKIGSQVDLGYMRFALEKLSGAKLSRQGEAFAEKGDMPKEIMENAEEIEKTLLEQGLEYIEKAKAKRSSLLHLARFINVWKNADESFVRIISRSGRGAKLSVLSLYPESIVSTFKEAHANVFMSATLAPIGMYKELFGLADADAKQYGSAFPPSNKAIFIDDSITTKYESRSVQEYKKIAQRLAEIKEAIPGNMAVFFPSFDVLNSTMRYMRDASIYVQRRSMSNVEAERMLEEFKKSSDSMLLGVMGGSLSEGIDYPNNVLKGVVMVGVPLSKPSLEVNARIGYYDKKFRGKGLEYAYITPAVVKGIQAAGRAVRSETDRAVLVFMDKRYRWRIYYPAMQNAYVYAGRDYISKIKEFWLRAHMSAAPK